MLTTTGGPGSLSGPASRSLRARPLAGSATTGALLGRSHQAALGHLHSAQTTTAG